MKVNFSGEITPAPNGSFTVSMSITGLATQADAQEVGAALHDRVESYFASKGAVLQPASPTPSLLLPAGHA